VNELLRRATDDPLSCSANLVCAVSGAALGCCPATTGVCTALYTTCYNFGDLCDAACEADNAIRKWLVTPPQRLQKSTFSDSVVAAIPPAPFAVPTLSPAAPISTIARLRAGPSSQSSSLPTSTSQRLAVLLFRPHPSLCSLARPLLLLPLPYLRL